MEVFEERRAENAEERKKKIQKEPCTAFRTGRYKFYMISMARTVIQELCSAAKPSDVQ